MTATKRKLAIVTGGGSGIGLAIAEKFVEQGIEVVIAGRNQERLDAAQQKLGALCHAMACDVTDLAAIPGFVQGVIDRYGPIDILVNNAGANMKKDFTEVTDEDFQQIILTNLTAVFAMSREVVKNMLQQQAGCIIHISSMAAQYGIPKVIAYSASKTAIDGMTRAMAVELSPKGIRVNAIAPGFIYSDMTAKALDSDPERKAKVFGRTPMGTMGQPADIGEAAWFLASDAAKFVTGVVLPVDGGNSIGF
ncbi:SDR family NAD(P)-dependent oxidoreductase [Chitinophaga ginsengisegetis]|uniref:SDR family NAD(P)-dependent oxidoreductase n=1 Tax=Chitinophaga ginsengisegetis TaxID=393003 RepID=UPI000DB9B934|nr:SDR family oxidoreductase [Chitinophaga ginsengisegetis]MDR6568674.1 NAD(P)-dependent dehydrogenase (short-subunit alcohol dehydrogenase family) [Chitinophaga ginsengisegetis]MDR6648095.1 NAD(P)-dependent dehydrogenase (short-subunit alcohol dehydrogenase family) [Chitinophaga ginsengisegetis]MDR6654755.1 NAD(P)-dependent dehydrogenase (short-subunit alcohol dehydrogenase family) [Chitinophaga ginsengisegetis]